MSIRLKVCVMTMVILAILITGCAGAKPSHSITPSPLPPTFTVKPADTPSPANMPAPPTPIEAATPSLTHTGSGGGVIAYCYQPMTDSSLKQIYAINADGSDNRKLVEATLGLNHHDWSPDAQKIAAVGYVDQTTWSIHVFDVDGSDLTRLTNTPGVWDSEPSWSPDGTQIVFVSGRSGHDEIYVMDADGGNVRQLTDNGAQNWTPSWSR